MTPAQVAARMGKPERTVRKWISQGLFPGATPPTEWDVSEEAYLNFRPPDNRGPKRKRKASA